MGRSPRSHRRGEPRARRSARRSPRRPLRPRPRAAELYAAVEQLLRESLARTAGLHGEPRRKPIRSLSSRISSWCTASRWPFLPGDSLRAPSASAERHRTDRARAARRARGAGARERAPFPRSAAAGRPRRPDEPPQPPLFPRSQRTAWAEAGYLDQPAAGVLAAADRFLELREEAGGVRLQVRIQKVPWRRPDGGRILGLCRHFLLLWTRHFPPHIPVEPVDNSICASAARFTAVGCDAAKAQVYGSRFPGGIPSLGEARRVVRKEREFPIRKHEGRLAGALRFSLPDEP